MKIAQQTIGEAVRERLLFLLYSNQIFARNKYKTLEKYYGISARRWQNVCNRVQMPGIDMLSVILMDRPEYATWLMFGEALDRNQINPITVNGVETGQIDLSVKGWEEKYDQILEGRYLGRFKNSETTTV